MHVLNCFQDEDNRYKYRYDGIVRYKMLFHHEFWMGALFIVTKSSMSYPGHPRQIYADKTFVPSYTIIYFVPDVLQKKIFQEYLESFGKNILELFFVSLPFNALNMNATRQASEGAVKISKHDVKQFSYT